jgi:beta-lactamase class D
MKKYLVVVAALIGGFQLMEAHVCFVAKENGKVLAREGACQKQFSPCSTFKAPLAVMGYDAGILVDETHPVWPFKPGYVDWFPTWKQAQNPTTWIKNSCVWYSQVLTKQLGMEKFQGYVDAFDYGNRDLAGDKGKDNGLTNAWLGSSLQISADEQVTFFEKLVVSQLPASQKAQQHARAILFVEDLPGGWKLYGKTGSGPLAENGAESKDKVLGWFVGWAQNGARIVVFAYNEITVWTGANPGKLAQDAAKARLGKLLK